MNKYELRKVKWLSQGHRAGSEDLHLWFTQFSCSVMSNSLRPHGLQHARPPCPSSIPRIYSNSRPLRRMMPSNHFILCCPILLSPNFPDIRSLQMSQFFTSGGQSIGVSASSSVLPMNIKEWLPLGRTGWISLLFKGPSRVFSSSTIQKHKIFGAQLSLYPNSHIHTWLLGKL